MVFAPSGAAGTAIQFCSDPDENCVIQVDPRTDKFIQENLHLTLGMEVTRYAPGVNDPGYALDQNNNALQYDIVSDFGTEIDVPESSSLWLYSIGLVALLLMQLCSNTGDRWCSKS
jgi:hypothetical protein